MADPGDGYVYLGLADKTVRRTDNAGTNTQWLAAQTYEPVLYAWGGTLFMLVGDDLYEINVSAAGTTLRADLSGTSTVYRADITSRGRITSSERGPVWLQRLDSGETYVWEYNVYADAQSRLGVLPVDYAWPYSIRYANGFILVAFRYANAHADAGNAYVYYQRGAQRGVLGPARKNTSGATGASEAIVLAGVIGEQIIFVFDRYLWGYTPSGGAMSQIGSLPTLSNYSPYAALTFGSQVFVSGLNDGTAGAVARFDLDKYATNGTIQSGRWHYWRSEERRVGKECRSRWSPYH